MANIELNARIQNKIDTQANWDAQTDFVPLAGEIIIYSDIDNFKIGDGITRLSDLKFQKDFIVILTLNGLDISYIDLLNIYNSNINIKAYLNTNNILQPLLIEFSDNCFIFTTAWYYIENVAGQAYQLFYREDFFSYDPLSLEEVFNNWEEPDSIDKTIITINNNNEILDIASSGGVVADILYYNNRFHYIILSNEEASSRTLYYPYKIIIDEVGSPICYYKHNNKLIKILNHGLSIDDFYLEEESEKQDKITGNVGDFVIIGEDGNITTKAFSIAEEMSF